MCGSEEKEIERTVLHGVCWEAPRNTILETPAVAQLFKELSAFSWNPKFCYRAHNIPLQVLGPVRGEFSL
jgi:hypothetical protein